MIALRRSENGGPESQYTVLAVLPQNKSFRVYMNAPGKRKTMLGSALIVSRKNFPDRLFDKGSG